MEPGGSNSSSTLKVPGGGEYTKNQGGRRQKRVQRVKESNLRDSTRGILVPTPVLEEEELYFPSTVLTSTEPRSSLGLQEME